MATDLHRRDVLGALGGAAALSVAGAPVFAAARAASLPFLAVGDWGRDGASHQRDVAMRMGRAAEAIDAGFVLSVGDNFYNAGVKSVSDPQWRTSFEEVYTAASLQKPWHVALGNHDYRGSPQAQIDYSRTSPRWRMPARYYKLSGADLGAPQVDFFCIDTSPMVSGYHQEFDDPIQANVASQDVDAQLAWLEGGLAASKAPWKLVFGHHTVFSGGSTHGNTPELVARLKPILERHGVQAYINGHDHDLQHIQVAGVNYVCTGAGSEVRPVSAIPGTRFCLSRSGFSLYRLGLDALDLEFRDYLGATVYRAVLPRQGGVA